MRKHNQSITYYCLQARYLDRHNGGKWFAHTLDRWHDGRPGREKDSETDKKDDGSATGKVWQASGYEGVTNRRAARRWLSRVMKDPKSKKCAWRIVKITRTIKTEIIRGA